jgi:hypothetical protein
LTGGHKIRSAPVTKRVNRASKTGVKGVDTEISGQTHTLRKNSMNKLLMTLCVFAFAATAYAQGTAPATPAAPAPKAAEPPKAEAPMKADTSKMAATDTAKTTTKKKKKSTKHKTEKAASEKAPAK